MLSWLYELLGAFALALLLRLFVFNFARIDGQSMLPTLHDRDYALVWRLPYCFRAPRRREVVICHYPHRRMRRCRYLPQAFVKRVVGLPGDTVSFIDGTLHLNGEPQEEPYLDPRHCRIPTNRPERLLTRDAYFVLGDNRDRSNDSRNVGPLRRRAIRGRVVCVIWPPKHIGKVR